MLPAPCSVPAGSLDNRELDKLVGALGRNKATWRRALVLSQWLQDSGHVLDDRLCTTVSSSSSSSIHACMRSQSTQAISAAQMCPHARPCSRCLLGVWLLLLAAAAHPCVL